MKILIIRNDKLGDFVLSLPVHKLLKTVIPNVEIHTLVPDYTSELARIYPWIDKVIIDSEPHSTLAQQFNLLKTVRIEQYDAIITLFSTTRNGVLAFASGTKYRLAPATKLAQIFYNHKLTQRRSKSLKPEYEYNLDLAIKYLSDIGLSDTDIPKPPFLQFGENEISTIRTNFCKKYNINTGSKLIFVHPGTGGSATNLDIKQYAELIKHLDITNNYTVVITAGPDEIKYAEKLSYELKNIPHIVHPSTEGLVTFSKVIQFCDLFISGSTGPLHIAGALNKPTAAFYQRRRSATPLRWQTLNSEDRRLAFTPPEDEGESDMQKIDIAEAAEAINIKFLKG